MTLYMRTPLKVSTTAFEAFESLYHSDNDSVAEEHLDYYNRDSDSSVADIDENTVTDDDVAGLLDILRANTQLKTQLIDIVGANTKFIAFLQKQRETIARLRSRI